MEFDVEWRIDLFFPFRITSSTLEKQPCVSVSSFYSFISIGKKVRRDEIKKTRLKSSGEAPLSCRGKVAVARFETAAGEADAASKTPRYSGGALGDSERPSLNITVTSRLHFNLPVASEALRIEPKGNCSLVSMRRFKAHN